MKNLLDYTQEEMKEFISPAFRTKQIFDWIYKKNISSIVEMKNLPTSLREELSKQFYIKPFKILKEEKSRDGSIKYLFELRDKNKIESVLIPMKEEIKENDKIIRHQRFTICVSSQVGCKMGCSFCMTAKSGFIRDLSAGEIVEQVRFIKEINKIPYERRVNIVYMGMGEPLNNLENVSKAVKILSDNDGLGIATKRQTISTSGLSNQIKKLGELNLGVLLAISLHATSDELRQELMPINKAYNIKSIIDAIKEFPIDQRKRVMFEYLVLKDVNDSLEDAKRLVKLLNGIKAKVNLILFNPHPGSIYKRPNDEDVIKFQDYLSEKGITCTIRKSKGLDISAACGQLKHKYS